MTHSPDDTAPLIAEPVAEGLALLIAEDLEHSIRSLGYPVGMGLAPSPDDCQRAAQKIVGRIKDKALELLTERRADHV